jgi:hypothetical protein
VPVQGEPTELADVSCVSEDWCMAVGRVGRYPMVQVWDGAAWAVVPAPPLSHPSVLSARMTKVDCGTPTSCVARIDRFFADPADYQFVVVWDGATWHEVPPVDAVDYPGDDPAPFSCAPDGGCLLVISARSVTVEWDGSQLTTTPFSTSPPAYGDLQAIECLAADDCLGLSPDDLQRWDGSAWSTVPGSGLDPQVAPLTDFACGSPSTCVAFGHLGSATLGLHWDGGTWTSAPLPAATQFWSGDLSCAGPAGCVGLTDDGTSKATVAWNGDAWFLAPDAPAGTERLSCVALRCLAVGSSGSPATPVAATYTWTNA